MTSKDKTIGKKGTLDRRPSAFSFWPRPRPRAEIQRFLPQGGSPLTGRRLVSHPGLGCVSVCVLVQGGLQGLLQDGKLRPLDGSDGTGFFFLGCFSSYPCDLFPGSFPLLWRVPLPWL